MSRELSSQLQHRLDAFARSLPEGNDADRLDLLLLTLGDGLRLECEVPRPLVRWLEARTQRERADSLIRVRRSLERRPLPVSDEPDERLELAVQARDHAESALVAIRRIERENAWEAPGFEELDEVCGAFDAAVERFGREAVERALGPRSDMLGPGHWASRLPEREALADPGEPAIPPGEGRPSDEAIRAFVQEGRHQPTVLGLAALDRSFADELREFVDVMRDSGEHVGLAARRWARDHAAPSGESMAPISLALDMKRAAADAAHASSVLEDLGSLPVVRARAHLIIEAGHVTLELEATEALVEVWLGGVAATNDDGFWSVRVPYASVLALLVKAPDGRALDETLELEASP
jgi:hypothetical protein